MASRAFLSLACSRSLARSKTASLLDVVEVEAEVMSVALLVAVASVAAHVVAVVLGRSRSRAISSSLRAVVMRNSDAAFETVVKGMLSNFSFSLLLLLLLLRANPMACR